MTKLQVEYFFLDSVRKSPSRGISILLITEVHRQLLNKLKMRMEHGVRLTEITLRYVFLASQHRYRDSSLHKITRTNISQDWMVTLPAETAHDSKQETVLLKYLLAIHRPVGRNLLLIFVIWLEMVSQTVCPSKWLTVSLAATVFWRFPETNSLG